MFTNRLRFSYYIFFIFFSCSVLHAAEEEAPSLKGWRKTRAEIQARVEQEVKEQVETEVTLESAAASLNIRLPAVEPEKTQEDIFAEARKEAEKAALTARPLKPLQEIIQDAERRFPLYRVGDQVSVRTRIKTNPIASGIVGAISQERINIGSRWIPVKDIAEEPENRFRCLENARLETKITSQGKNNLQMAFLKNATNEIFSLNNSRKRCGRQDITRPAMISKSSWTPKNWVAEWERFCNRNSSGLRQESHRQTPPGNRNANILLKISSNTTPRKKNGVRRGVFQSLKNLFE